MVILELLDEVCQHLRYVCQEGRRVGLGVNYEHFEGGFRKAKTLSRYTNDPKVLYMELLALLDRHWDGYTGVQAVCVAVDMLQSSDNIQLSLFDNAVKKRALYFTIDQIHKRFGKTSLMRAVSLTNAGQLRDRSRRIGGHFA